MEANPDTTILVDTYDTLEGVRRVVELSREMGNRFNVRSIRIDSGNLASHARHIRAILDEAGLRDVTIFATSGLDEVKIARLIAAGAPIDGFGVGTSLAVSEDAPAIDMVYKLVEYAGEPRIKLSANKETYPRPKQVVRCTSDGLMVGDVLARAEESHEGEPLLERVMQNGKRLDKSRRTLEQIRDHARQELERLPARWKRLETAETPYPVEVAKSLTYELEELRERFRSLRGN